MSPQGPAAAVALLAPPTRPRPALSTSHWTQTGTQAWRGQSASPGDQLPAGHPEAGQGLASGDGPPRPTPPPGDWTDTRHPRNEDMGQRAPSHVVQLYVNLIGINSSVEFRGLAKVSTGF